MVELGEPEDPSGGSWWSLMILPLFFLVLGEGREDEPNRISMFGRKFLFLSLVFDGGTKW